MKRLSILMMLATPAIAQAAEAEGGSPSPFAGTIAQSIAALLVFFIVFFVLKAKAWGPILKGLNDREGKIRADLEAAEKARVDAEKAMAEYKRQLADGQNQVREMFASAQKDAEALGTRLKMQAQQEIEEDKKRARAEIESARKEAVAQVHAEAAMLGTSIASKILKRQISEADQHELVRASLDELAGAGRR